MIYDIIDALSFFFPFSPSPSSIEYFHSYWHVLHLGLYMIMFVFVYIFIIWTYLPHIRENMQLLSFWVWLTSLNMMSSNYIHLLSNQCHYSLWLSKTLFYMYIYIYIYHISLIHSSVIGHLGCFHSLAILNSAVISIGVQVSLLYPDLHSFG
jgi:hypothetical protein